MMANTDTLRHMSLTNIQRRAIFKLAIELVKADNKIHSKEISILDKLQQDLCMPQEEIDLIHYFTLQDSISAVMSIEDEDLKVVLDLFCSIMKADNDIDFEENLLLSAIHMSCSNESREWVSILSAPGLETDVPNRQIIFLEKTRTQEAHSILDDKYDNLLISKAFGDAGFEFFYLPNILGGLGMGNYDGKDRSERFRLLQKSMEYLMPAGDKIKVNNLDSTLESYDTTVFFKVVQSRYGLNPDFFPYNAFMLVKIRDSYVLDDDSRLNPTVDFLCFDMSKDVKKRILDFVSRFDDISFLLPYEGYYKILFDDLSSEAKITSNIILDSSLNFRLEEFEGLKLSFESSPQSRTFYLLLLKYGACGLSQSIINDAIEFLKTTDTSQFIKDDRFNISDFCSNMLKLNRPETILIYNAITIYRAISTKDEQKSSFLGYITSILSHRSSLKTYVNKCFLSVSKLAHPELYFIAFNREFDSYSVKASISLFQVMLNGETYPLSSSRLWDSLV